MTFGPFKLTSLCYPDGMKNVVRTGLVGLLLLVNMSAFAGETKVYITRTGKKYHRDGCRSLSKSKIEVTLTEAKARGYGACKICKPPTQKVVRSDQAA